jgi:predicted nucleotidyltransferase
MTWKNYVDTINEISKYQKMVRNKHKKNKSMYLKGGHKNTKPYTKKPSAERGPSAPAGAGALEEINPAEVPVAGFDQKDTLEPEVWVQNKIDPAIRENLVQIANDFIDGLDVNVQIIDIRLTGSLANYNWSKYSDIDLHIVVKFSEMDENFDLVKGFFDGKRINWNHSHDIILKGYEVEIYVEDESEKHISTGIYSIMNDDWIIEPEKGLQFEIDEPNVQKKAASIMRQIEMAEEKLEEEPQTSYNMAERLKEKIRNMRQAGLESKLGQYSIENVAFKVLRRTDYLERLSDLKNQSYDKQMSID